MLTTFLVWYGIGLVSMSAFFIIVNTIREEVFTYGEVLLVLIFGLSGVVAAITSTFLLLLIAIDKIATASWVNRPVFRSKK